MPLPPPTPSGLLWRLCSDPWHPLAAAPQDAELPSSFTIGQGKRRGNGFRHSRKDSKRPICPHIFTTTSPPWRTKCGAQWNSPWTTASSTNALPPGLKDKWTSHPFFLDHQVTAKLLARSSSSKLPINLIERRSRCKVLGFFINSSRWLWLEPLEGGNCWAVENQQGSTRCQEGTPLLICIMLQQNKATSFLFKIN